MCPFGRLLTYHLHRSCCCGFGSALKVKGKEDSLTRPNSEWDFALSFFESSTIALALYLSTFFRHISGSSFLKISFKNNFIFRK